MDSIGREDVPVALFVSVTVFILGIVASTIDDVTEKGGGVDVDIDPRSGDGIEETNATLRNISESGQGLAGQEQTIDLVICIDVLTTMPAILGIVVGGGVVLYGLYRRYNGATSLLVGTGGVPIVWGTYFFLTNCPTTENGGGGSLLSGQSVVTNQGGVSSPSIPPWVVAGLFGVVVVAGIALLKTRAGKYETVEPIEAEPDEPDAAAFGRAAGRAADRIEATNAPVDNAVYRAWLEMTGLLDIENPKTTAPRDFAAAAIEFGLDEADVTELTDLFTDVRYGGKSAEDREERALEILRRIERTYQDASGGPGGNA